jgi:hypothetical protein
MDNAIEFTVAPRATATSILLRREWERVWDNAEGQGNSSSYKATSSAAESINAEFDELHMRLNEPRAFIEPMPVATARSYTRVPWDGVTNQEMEIASQNEIGDSGEDHMEVKTEEIPMPDAFEDEGWHGGPGRNPESDKDRRGDHLEIATEVAPMFKKWDKARWNRVPELEGAGGWSSAIRVAQLDSVDDYTSTNRAIRPRGYGGDSVSPTRITPSTNIYLHACDGMDCNCAIQTHERRDRQSNMLAIGHEDDQLTSSPGANTFSFDEDAVSAVSSERESKLSQQEAQEWNELQTMTSDKRQLATVGGKGERNHGLHEETDSDEQISKETDSEEQNRVSEASSDDTARKQMGLSGQSSWGESDDDSRDDGNCSDSFRDICKESTDESRVDPVSSQDSHVESTGVDDSEDDDNYSIAVRNICKEFTDEPRVSPVSSQDSYVESTGETYMTSRVQQLDLSESWRERNFSSMSDMAETAAPEHEHAWVARQQAYERERSQRMEEMRSDWETAVRDATLKDAGSQKRNIKTEEESNTLELEMERTHCRTADISDKAVDKVGAYPRVHVELKEPRRDPGPKSPKTKRMTGRIPASEAREYDRNTEHWEIRKPVHVEALVNEVKSDPKRRGSVCSNVFALAR